MTMTRMMTGARLPERREALSTPSNLVSVEIAGVASALWRKAHRQVRRSRRQLLTASRQLPTASRQLLRGSATCTTTRRTMSGASAWQTRAMMLHLTSRTPEERSTCAGIAGAASEAKRQTWRNKSRMLTKRHRMTSPWSRMTSPRSRMTSPWPKMLIGHATLTLRNKVMIGACQPESKERLSMPSMVVNPINAVTAGVARGRPNHGNA
mmetsp:Transcript_44107/g.80691  ORF Transcript_44107/g.80691 Transcript_44107/m.80691 type:complete len:209 (+) Transcript_44107:948-1574(+)